jgi:hypothetical protein
MDALILLTAVILLLALLGASSDAAGAETRDGFA